MCFPVQIEHHLHIKTRNFVNFTREQNEFYTGTAQACFLLSEIERLLCARQCLARYYENTQAESHLFHTLRM